MNRRSANALRILGIVLTVIVVLALSLVALWFALFIAMMGGLSQGTRVLHPRAANSFYGLILLVVATVAGGITLIGRLATGIVKVPVRTGASPVQPAPRTTTGEPPSPVSSLAPPPRSSAASLRLSPRTRNTIDRLALVLGAHIAVSAITWFQIASRYAPRSLTLLPPFLLSEAPYALLIYFLLKRPGRRSFTFLLALLVLPILDVCFNPLVIASYRQIYANQSMGSVWLALSGLIYIVTVFLSYQAIRQTGLNPQPSWLILASVAAYFYFFLVREITPYLYSLWKQPRG